jgi:hypothetical protein
VNTDSCSETKSLLIYLIFGHASRQAYEEGMLMWHSHAKQLGCSFICAYTIHENVVSLAKSLGFESQYYLSLEVK